MSDTSTSGSTPNQAPAATAGAPTEPAADWGAASSTLRGSGLARGKRVSAPAPVSTTTISGTYQPSSVQILKAETEYQNPFASADVAPAAAAKPAEAPTPAPIAPVATESTAPAPKPELNILPPAEVKRPAQSWETPAFPYEGDKPAAAAKAPVAPSLTGERPVFRPVRRSDVPMLEPAPNAGGNAPRGDFRGGQRQGRGNHQNGNRGQRHQPRDGGQRQGRDAGPSAPKAANAPVNKPAPTQETPKKPSGLFGWVKGLFGTAAPTDARPQSPGRSDLPPAAAGGQRSEGGGQRRRRRRGGRGRSGGGQGGSQGSSFGAQSHGQGHPSHGHGGGEHRPREGGGGRHHRRGRSDGGHRHEGGGSGLPPSA